MNKEIVKFVDKEGKIISWPRKEKDKEIVIKYLASLFEIGKIYTEREVTQTIINHHLFMLPTMLRRELITRNYFDRKIDGSAYWKIKN